MSSKLFRAKGDQLCDPGLRAERFLRVTGPLTARMVKARAMALKAVVPGVPKSVKDRELLEEDLRRIGCHKFLDRPWRLRMEDMVVELLGDKDNRSHETVRQAPEKWTAKEWRKV